MSSPSDVVLNSDVRVPISFVKKPKKMVEHGAYRLDIDGLRAIAVGSVVLFHMWPLSLPGGFVGVDVFFVISGFLITNNLLRDLKNRSFSLWEFYRRRVRRIIPAMICMLLFALIGSFVFVYGRDPSVYKKEIHRLSWTGIWTILSSANFYLAFGMPDSYWDESSKLNPLLHMWSLAVEEQYYLFFAPMLSFLYNKGLFPHLRKIFIPMMFLSFGVSQWLCWLHPTSAYYMLPSRFGEMLMGSLLSTMGRDYCLSVSFVSPKLDHLIGAAAFFAICFPMFVFSESVPFPGFVAFIPCFGTTVILALRSKNSFVNRLLQLDVFVQIGLISYSLYLFHWPIFAWCRTLYFSMNSATGACVALSLTLAASVTCYVLVETPLRKVSWSPQQTVWWLFVVPSVVVVAVCFALLSVIPNPAACVPMASASPGCRPIRIHGESRFETVKTSHTFVQRSDYRPGDREAMLMLVGDSHAGALFGVLTQYVGWHNKTMFFHARDSHIGFDTYSACPEQAPPWSYNSFCQVNFARQSGEKVDLIVIAGRYSSYGQSVLSPLSSLVDYWTAKGKRVVLFGENPQQCPGMHYCPLVLQNASVPLRCLQRYDLSSYKTQQVDPTDILSDQRHPFLNDQIKAIADRKPNVSYFDLWPLICRDECKAYNAEGIRLYKDSNHLSLAGSYILGNEVIKKGWNI